VAQLAALGVRRISVGGGLARAAWTAATQAAQEIVSLGTFTGLARAASFAEIYGDKAD
jgi:2-methylisocitrate lyase-like PEP mutase family enzyme